MVALINSSVAFQNNFQLIVFLHRDQRLEGSCKFIQIPETDVHLILEIVSSHVIRMVWNESRVVLVNKSKWSVVYSYTGNTHVISVKNPMSKSHRHPLGNQESSLVYNL